MRFPDAATPALLYVSQGSQLVYRRYPYLCDLETGELIDILSGTGVNELEFPYQYIFSDSMNRLFVTTHEPRRTYYCDIARVYSSPWMSWWIETRSGEYLLTRARQ